MISAFIQMVKSKIRKDLNDRCDNLASNRCKTIEDYRFECGVLRGLAIAEEYLLSTRDELEKKDDE